jgi:two-component sensor histidine kinase
VEITASVLEHKGKNFHFVAFRDISERKIIEQKIEASLKEKEILLSEIHQRVKNNFEIISSLLDMASMTSDNQEVKNILLSSRTRIHSMAMIHSQLYQSKWFNRVDMVNHINELAETLRFLYKSEKNIEVASHGLTPVALKI